MRFKKGVQRINIPIFPEINGELERRIKNFLERSDLPKKFRIIGISREINFDKRLGYDLTQIYLEK